MAFLDTNKKCTLPGEGRRKEGEGKVVEAYKIKFPVEGYTEEI